MKTVEQEMAFMNVTREQLADAVALHAKWVLECLRSRTEEDTWMPQLAVFVKAGPTSGWSVNMYSLAIPFNEDAEKRAALEQIGAGIARERLLPGFAIMSSEAWVSNQKAGHPRVEPRLDPNRREAIVVFGLARAAGLAARTRMFISRGRKKAIVPSEFEPVETEGVHSRLLNYIWDGFLQEVMAVPCTTHKAPRASATGLRNCGGTMARRTVKIGKVKSFEEARAIIAELTPDELNVTTSAYCSNSRTGGHANSSTNYTARVYSRSFKASAEVNAHTPLLLVQRFVEHVLPKLQAGDVPEEPEKEPQRLNGFRPRRLLEVDPTV